MKKTHHHPEKATGGIARRVIVAAVFAAFVFSCCSAEAGEFRRRYSNTLRDTIPWKSGQIFNIIETSGDILVRGSKREDAQLKGIRTCFAHQLSAARDCVSDLSMDMDMLTNSLRIRTLLPTGWATDTAGHIDYELDSPKEATMTLETVTGDIQVSGIDGLINATSVTGDITIESPGGETSASTFSGNIAINSASELNSVSAYTGGITIQLDKLESGNLQISDVTGPVKVVISNDLNAAFALSTVSGRIETKDSGLAIKSIDGGKIVGTAGKGEKSVTIRTVSGNITIVNDDSESQRHDGKK